MTGTTPLLALTYPTSTDAASPAGIQTLAQQLEKFEVGVFATTAARDTAWTNAGGLANGALAFITGTGELQLRSGGAWVVIGGRAAPFATQSGTVNVTTAANVTSGPTNQAWATGRFSAAPLVTGTINTVSGSLANGAGVRVVNITTTAADFYLNAPANSTAGAAMPIFWHAVQMTSAAAAG